MKQLEWIREKDSILDDWQVDIAFNNDKEFSAGHLYVTDQQIQIEAAGGLCHLGDVRNQLPVNDECNHLIAPYDQIKSVDIEKHYLFLNYLILTLKSNHIVMLKFGLESPTRAKQQILRKLH